MAKTIMIQGTASHVGKSYIATALCRIFKEDGFRVAPFKGWNMSLNSSVTPDGGEISRSQAEQARAAGAIPTVDMNPLLIKPAGYNRAQVVVRGKPWKNATMDDRDEDGYRDFCLETIKCSVANLLSQYDILVLEGAGSPAEINLRNRDLANMAVAKIAEAPVILVADVSRGGALAAVVGTLMLLSPQERAMVVGIVFNKFGGDISLFKPAVTYIQEHTGIPVLGVVPLLKDVYLAEEDSLALDEKKTVPAESKSREQVKIAVLYLNHISNFTDFDKLADEKEIFLQYIKPGEALEGFDALIIPGSKNSLQDLRSLKESGSDREIIQLAAKGVPVVGICGGYQIIGKKLLDPQGHESNLIAEQGLGLLDVVTTYSSKKVTRLVAGEAAAGLLEIFPALRGKELAGYEIHMGKSKRGAGALPLLRLKEENSNGRCVLDGAVGPGKNVWGTYLHGIFDNHALRREFIDYLKKIKGMARSNREPDSSSQQDNFGRLAAAVRSCIDMERIYTILEKGGG